MIWKSDTSFSLMKTDDIKGFFFIAQKFMID